MDQPFTEKYHSPRQKPRILVAPLDWGLGHATRCIPIIKELVVHLIARSGLPATARKRNFCRLEFPSLPFLELEGYKVRYARSITGMIFKIAGQARKIFKAIHKEHAWLNKCRQGNINSMR